jgi:hypothetical protein
LNGFCRHLNIDVKTANGWQSLVSTVQAVASSEEAVDIDDVLEETPLVCHLASLVSL